MKNRSIRATILLPFVLVACKMPESTNHSPTARKSFPQQTPSEDAAQPFDFYLLNLSWSPEFCHSHPSAIECTQRSAFVLHGLWPQNTSGPFPEHCSNAPGPDDPAQYSDIYPDTGLLRHEWQTHGTCSGLAPDAFFHLARQAFHSVIIPAQLASLDRQISMPPTAILHLFTDSNPSLPSGSLALSCGNNYLTAIEVCLSKNLRPVSCGSLRSCRANSVRITPHETP